MQEHESGHVSDTDACQVTATREPPVIPRPIFIRLLVCFAAGPGFLLVGTFAAVALRDISLFVGAAVIGIVFVCSGVILKRKVRDGKIYSVSGVCLDITPRFYGRYSRIEMVEVDTGENISFTLPRKVAFKRGHFYTCYFDHRFYALRDNSDTNPKASINESLDLPTSGFLGYEHQGLYQANSGKSNDND